MTKGEYFIVSGRINDLAWDGDSQRIIAVGEGQQRFGHCITADSGNTVGEITGHSQRINSVSIRQQRPLRAAAAGDDRTMVFYHGAPFKYNTGLRDNHINYIYGVAFSPDGGNLVSVGGDKRIWLYDGKTGEPKTQLGDGEHKGSIFGVSWAPDSRRFATASADRTVKIWDVEYGKTVQEWSMGDGVLDQQVGIVWPSGRSDGLLISLSLSGTLNYLTEGSDKPTRKVQGHQKNITSISHSGFTADETFWTGSYDGRLCKWDVPSGSAEMVAGRGHDSYIAGLASTKDNSGRIYSVGWDDSLRSVDAHSNGYTEYSEKLSGQPRSIATTGNIALVANSDSVEIFSDGTKTGQLDSKTAVTSVASIEGTAAVGYEDSSIRIGKVDKSTLHLNVETKMSRNPITALSFSADGSVLAAGDSRGKIVVFNVADGSVVVDRWTAHTARIASLAWNSQGTHLASASLDTHIFVWSMEHPGDWLQAKNTHKEGVNAVTWVRDEFKIISAGADGAVKTWQVEPKK